MKPLILYAGYFFVICGLFTLAYLAWTAQKMKFIEEDQRKEKIQLLVILNFVGIGLSIIGLIMIVMNSFL